MVYCTGNEPVAGTPEAPVSIMEARCKMVSKSIKVLGICTRLINSHGKKIAHRDTAMLSAIPVGYFKNDHAYNKFKSAPYGIEGEVGAKATITLPAIESPQQDELTVTPRLVNSRGTEFTITLKSYIPGECRAAWAVTAMQMTLHLPMGYGLWWSLSGKSHIAIHF